MRSSTRQERARRPRIRVLGAVILTVAALSALTAQPAAAHFNAEHYITAVSGVRPAVAGLEVSAARNGRWLSITNKTGQIVTVLGYQHEPYLQITSHGVWQNTLSPAVHLNDDLSSVTGAQPPGQADPTAAPKWRHVSDSSSYRFHDHRIVWTDKRRPAVVTRDPGRPHLIRQWTIGLLVGRIPVTVDGTLSWVPTGHLVRALEWLFGLICLALLIAFAIASVIDSRRQPATDPGSDQPEGARAPTRRE